MNSQNAVTLHRPVRNFDRWLHAQFAHISGGLSLTALQLAFSDWLLHLVNNPAQIAELVQEAQQQLQTLALVTIMPSVLSSSELAALHDHRFEHPHWKKWPFNVFCQSFLCSQRWWQHATTDIRGVSAHHEEVVSFTVRQLLDFMSPANTPLTNPVVLERTIKTAGSNLIKGADHYLEDLRHYVARTPPKGIEAYEVGVTVAVTPGRVIFRNRLIELIQYSPSTDTVHPEPILIVPAWIMKYYILDLSPHNSLVKYLVDQGHTVFIISWINPTAQDRDLGMDDYLDLGIMHAFEKVCEVVPDQKVHMAGYCLGGTLLAIAASAMGRDKDSRIASMTLLAAQTDFTEPGDVALFIDESQVSLLEDSMWETGYLDNQQMSGSFKLTNSNERVWSIVLHDYLMGERGYVSDMMAWNIDSTRLPYRMHTEYLRTLYLFNDLARGRYLVEGKPVSLTDIACPVFVVGTETDSVAPWRSVYKINIFTHMEITFVLTSGGHNVGIVNPPNVANRHYRALTRAQNEAYLGPDEWLESLPREEGSWWPLWHKWLADRSSPKVEPPPMGFTSTYGKTVCAAPGTYVLQK
ncbi:MAG: alpha/beta fold hydrolase [Burkholderiales bacterium]|nr:alpha/beta fold hydrolase [Burkholderiales bacterium]